MKDDDIVDSELITKLEDLLVDYSTDKIIKRMKQVGQGKLFTKIVKMVLQQLLIIMKQPIVLEYCYKNTVQVQKFL